MRHAHARRTDPQLGRGAGQPQRGRLTFSLRRAGGLGWFACLPRCLAASLPARPASDSPSSTDREPSLSLDARATRTSFNIHQYPLSTAQSNPPPLFPRRRSPPPPPPLFPSSIALAAPKPAPSPSRVHPRAYPSRQHARILAQDTPHQHRIRHPCCAPVYFRPLARFGRVY